MMTLDGTHLISWLVEAPLFAVLVDTRKYKYFPEHRWLAAIEGAEGWHEPLMNKKVYGRTLYADDTTFRLVRIPAGAVVIYVKRANPKTSPVLIFTNEMTGLPVKGNGSDVVVPFSQGVLRV